MEGHGSVCYLKAGFDVLGTNIRVFPSFLLNKICIEKHDNENMLNHNGSRWYFLVP
jgi:hypothetical protein